MKTKRIGILILFAILNFGALGIGTYFMDNGPNDLWYLALNKAPWTPPGWVFGAAWFTIMLCYSFFMMHFYYLFKSNKTFLILFGIQWILNISWNLFFFNLHEIFIGLLVLLLLILTLLKILKMSFRKGRYQSLLIIPYILWMMVAISLNAYIYFNN
ncbi:MAG: TspO protein [Bacteroidetes bacterium MedPE-SWsnd-G1]|nr:MAG: TspO protein [Bacteroidetes bacterium MedPE-SWsnd-G1]